MDKLNKRIHGSLYVTNNKNTCEQYREFAEYIKNNGLDVSDKFIEENVFIKNFLRNIFNENDIIINEKDEFVRIVKWDIGGDCKNFYPDSKRVKAGRLNPIGVAYLYLGNNISTSMKETRVSDGHPFCIGLFKPIKELKILDFTTNRELEEKKDNSYKYIVDKMFSKHTEKCKDEREYWPTQFITNLIIDKGVYDGVKYSSAVQKGGYNICIFKCENMKCVKW
jgi:RES domain-containing protein